MDGEQRREHPGRSDDDTRRQVELAANHEQGDGKRRHTEKRGGFDVGLRTLPDSQVSPPCHVKRETRRSPRRGRRTRADHQPGERRPASKPLVGRRLQHHRSRRGCHRGAPLVLAAAAFARQLEHLLGVLGGDETGTGIDRQTAADGVEVVVVQHEEHDREVPLEVLLLVDGELHVAVDDRLDHVGAEVECGNRHLAEQSELLKCRHGRC